MLLSSETQIFWKSLVDISFVEYVIYIYDLYYLCVLVFIKLNCFWISNENISFYILFLLKNLNNLPFMYSSHYDLWWLYYLNIYVYIHVQEQYLEEIEVLFVTLTSAKMLIKCGYFTFTNAAIEPHLINTHS